jgi:hypothetical protein
VWPPALAFRDIELWRYFGKNDEDIRRATDMLHDRGRRPPTEPTSDAEIAPVG